MVFGESALYSDEGMRIRQATVTIAKNPDGEKNVEVSSQASKQARNNKRGKAIFTFHPHTFTHPSFSHTHMHRAATRSL